MIDQVTNARVLNNWKREGLRVIKRRSEYVYTPVVNTPFSVAIASPKSFGRFYIRLNPALKDELNEKLINLEKGKIYESLIQVYNCTYTFSKLVERFSSKSPSDSCIRYLYEDEDQILSVKSDIVLHDIFYSKLNSTKSHRSSLTSNQIVSSFYGSYSGLTFYFPTAFFKPKQFSDDAFKNNEEINSSEQKVKLF